MENVLQGKYVIGRVEKQFLSQDDKMSTRLILYTDSPGSFPEMDGAT